MSHENALEQYRTEGYAVIPNALSEAELDELNQLIDRDREANPDEWHEPNNGASGNTDLFMKHPEKLDRFIRHRTTFPLFQEILGGDARFAQFDFRDVKPEHTDESGMEFHRDISFYGEAGGKTWDPDNPYKSTFACAIYYLQDVHECCPCFTIVPKSHEYRSFAEAKEELGDEYEEVEIRGEAGTAVLYNITTFHTRRAGQTDCPHGRRTMHNYQSRESNPPLTEWVRIPEELALSDDEATRRYYSQWTPEGIEYARENYEGDVPSYYP